MSESRPNPPPEPPSAGGRGTDLVRGLPMFTASDPAALEAERQDLAALARRPVPARWWGYARRTGPGWLQSAMTLGGGTAASSLMIGAFFGYKLLWVQPLAMALGVVMLSAVSYQTLATGARPFGAMRQYVGAPVAWAWALATLLATLIWHLPQYALAAGVTEDMITAATAWAPQGGARTGLFVALGAAYLAISVAITWNYGSGRRGIRLYERALKAMVWLIILAFAVVIVRSTLEGKVAWLEVLKGFLPLYIPTDARGIEVVMSAFGASVGINMTFLYPYSILARGWGKEHWGLSKFDLVSGMFLPFVVATSLMIMAAGCTIYGHLDPAAQIKPVEAAQMIAASGVGPLFGRVIFGLGILGMALSSITTHMIVAGFAACEIFGIEPRGWKYRLACLIPAPGVVGVVLWGKMGFWIGVRTSALCGLLLPIAYLAFFVLQNRRAYLGDDRPRGAKAWAWNLGMGLAIAATVASIVYFLIYNYDKVLGLQK